jgi:CRISPR/Cas system-associated exonuclease Cas4 (RecB family)
MTEHIKSTSFSRLQVFETCKFRAKLQYLDRIPDPQPKTAADRGTAIHQMGEDFVRGIITDLPRELNNYADEFYKLRELFLAQPHAIILEDEWGFDTEWNIAPYEGAWLRMKLDACVFLTPYEVAVIDYKTGRKFGNEIKHGDQCLNYAAAVAARYPEVEIIHTELWYLDKNEITKNTYLRAKAAASIARYDKRHKALTNATRFPPNPNIHSCKWCPYKPEPAGTGNCEYGVV